ncbi:hypothetical protein B9T62_06505 [Paenibacillus donghaensis]|uniref:Uncharacterized protein n=1 Tax=Paenibacillus donghaensis TaxID=414771 RepID=A0A2Z2KC47_9BACL|nr:hypothetical protein B9T62_06505 [Paenibacillus donghaensis]
MKRGVSRREAYDGAGELVGGGHTACGKLVMTMDHTGRRELVIACASSKRALLGYAPHLRAGHSPNYPRIIKYYIDPNNRKSGSHGLENTVLDCRLLFNYTVPLAQ